VADTGTGGTAEAGAGAVGDPAPPRVDPEQGREREWEGEGRRGCFG
jgi:hypothetical protein